MTGSLPSGRTNHRRTPGGRSAAGSASPCQGEGRGFESRRPLGGRFWAFHRIVLPVEWPMVEWPRGEATACKAVYTGSNPVSTSYKIGGLYGRAGAISSVGEHYLDTVGVTGSIPVSPTTYRPRIPGPVVVSRLGEKSLSGVACNERATRAASPTGASARCGSPNRPDTAATAA
jgi:hypothetical protein